jgi:hypothetical protein
MAVNRDQLFAELEALTEAEIEARLDAGGWSEEKRQLVEHYLDQLKLTTMQMEAATSAKEARVGGGVSRQEGNFDSVRGLVVHALQEASITWASSSRRAQWSRQWLRRSWPSLLFGIDQRYR